jgi:phosphoribosylformylglycinamidine cyclo-ligase
MDPLTYRAAGVDIQAGDLAVRRIAPLAASTHPPEVLGGIGAFAAFFLDYLAVNRVDPERIEAIVAGIAAGCRQAGCALVGGETAEMGSFYAPGEYDLAGFAVGVAERSALVTGQHVAVGDRVLGLASSGLHSNGYTLAREAVFGRMGLKLGDPIPGTGRSVVEELLEPTRIYVKPVLGVLREVTVFPAIQRAAAVDDAEMRRTFNMGVGFVLIVSPADIATVIERLQTAGERCFEIGEVVAGEPGVDYV